MPLWRHHMYVSMLTEDTNARNTKSVLFGVRLVFVRVHPDTSTLHTLKGPDNDSRRSWPVMLSLSKLKMFVPIVCHVHNGSLNAQCPIHPPHVFTHGHTCRNQYCWLVLCAQWYFDEGHTFRVHVPFLHDKDADTHASGSVCAWMVWGRPLSASLILFSMVWGRQTRHVSPFPPWDCAVLDVRDMLSVSSRTHNPVLCHVHIRCIHKGRHTSKLHTSLRLPSCAGG